MNNRIVQPPVIIIGMHRSGTSMVARMLETLGLFLGHRKDINNEAYLFLKLNDWMLWQSGASWDNPEPARHIIELNRIRALILEYIHYVFNSPWVISYLGIRKYFRYRGLHRIDFPWGWKDPRNTLLLPIWRDIFPNAKLIHVRRNGVDVASSLNRRSEKTYQRKLRFYRHLKGWYWFIRKRRFFVDSPRCLDIEKGIALWDMYMKTARAFLQEKTTDCMEISYEEMLNAPAETLRNLSAFCGLNSESGSIARAVSIVRPKRVIPASEKDILRRMAQKHAACLREHGY